jgi:glycogen synthase
MSTKIVFMTYETCYAPCGGIQAVMNHLPAAVVEAARMPAFIVTPYHHRIARTASLKPQAIATMQVPYGKLNLTVDILLKSDPIPVYFIRPQEKSFFAGKRHPYDVDTSGANSRLLYDAMLFGASAAKALSLIAPNSEFTLMMQDWEAATAALFARPGEKCRHFLTMHNSYDSPLSDEVLIEFGLDPRLYPGETVLQRVLPRAQPPVFTVSDQFAVDLISDPLQKTVMAPHLQEELGTRLVGVCNGPFVDLKLPTTMIKKASRNYKLLETWKSEQKAAALEALAEVKVTEQTPVWGNPKQFREEDAPWFVFAGRDDSRQKGYDVAVAAIREFLAIGGHGQFLFFPIPGDEGLKGLSWLADLATEYPTNVIAFPFIWREGFSASLSGAAYGVMPSLYEPFGMASEFYLNGTIGIARATGGLIQQISPLRELDSYTSAAARLVKQWHNPTSKPTGLLFREPDDLPSESDDWRAINAAAYNSSGACLNRVSERMKLPLFKEMVIALTKCLIDASELYKNRPELYYQMLLAGIKHSQAAFSWKKSAEGYLRKTKQSAAKR